MTQVGSGLLEWLSKGYHGEMDYMAKQGARRTRGGTRHAVCDLGTHELHLNTRSHYIDMKRVFSPQFQGSQWVESEVSYTRY
ncbi:hypothetical protein NNRS527_02753 [Nitrosospira sp. NRS527]|nr:hypothetical protein NNRS527_02753 [Nitrosospira sp. NRS527]